MAHHRKIIIRRQPFNWYVRAHRLELVLIFLCGVAVGALGF